ncbi:MULTISPECIES: hypothetical protein [unclassified Streptomyces]|uniref:hypothetical protein n=1 Tax=unclassified Streptomyces TaxID=2593676 RepID=UPI0006AE377F|nr:MULTISPECIES: hypothetical protein [unclassified Streptomyces]KOX33068.1 hypothetical protein ADL06_10085 [Streptomyces sp. NRRL F-6491]KOX36219.1 hypothetical protein ADL08_32920 [Streptomyces sp. NRRL F-6492]
MPVITVRITAPVRDYTGDGPGGLHFVDGTATTDDIAIIGYCQGAGYSVEPLDDDPPGETPAPEPDGPPDDKSAGRSGSRRARG